MKVDPKSAVTQAVVAKAQPFKQLLAEAKADLKKTPRAAVPPAAAPMKKAEPVVKSVNAQATATRTLAHAPTEVLQRARVQVDGEAQRLSTVRSEHAQTAQSLQTVRSEASEVVLEKNEHKVLELITKELLSDAPPANRPEPILQPSSAPVGTPAAKVETTPEAKAAQAVALIEKIERFVKSQRPGLALTLNNSLGAHVEIERIGPKEIALKLVGHRGPPSAEAVSRIREELRARGLRVGALSVA